MPPLTAAERAMEEAKARPKQIQGEQGITLMNRHALVAESRCKGMAKPSNDIEGIRHILMGSPICILLLFAPFGIYAGEAGFSEQVVFWANFIAMIPLAKVLGDATEELALNLKNDMLSGLLNATFGNAVEMIVTVTMLQKHEYETVKNTLLGSVLSNMLLVLGMSFTAGGLTASVTQGNAEMTDNEKPLISGTEGGAIRQEETRATIEGKEQSYNVMGALSNTSMLLLSGLILALVTVYHNVIPDSGAHVLQVSRVCSIFIIISYAAYIVFQLFTHREAMNDAGEEGEDAGEEANLSMCSSVLMLFGSTCVVAMCSEYLTDSLNGAIAGGVGGVHITKAFLGIILLPIVGNACEHAAAIRFAIQDKAGLSVGIAIGSSVQIALFVAPFSVITGWLLGDDKNGNNMDLDFGKLNVAVFVLSVVVIMSIVVDGKANWLEGWMLMTAYCMVSVVYWFVEDTL